MARAVSNYMTTTVRQKARGAEILLEILRSEGTKFIFGNPGTTELPLIDALVVNPDIRYILGLQEASVVGMADGYSQASGKPAFVNLHTSGGLGHGMGAIMNAKIARVPMVVTAGQQDLRHILADPLLAADLVQIAAPGAKWCFEPNALDDLPLILRRAFHSSVTPPRGPVFLSLPMNILDEIGSPRVLPPSHIELSSVGLGVKELAAGLLRFKPFRTVILAGNDIAELGLGKATARVAQLIGAPVYGASWPSVNSYASIDPFWRGSLPITAKGISEILSGYDCLLALGGKSLISVIYTMRDPIPESIEFYHISEDANDLGYNDAPKLGVFGNVRATLEALADELEPKVPPAVVKQNIEEARHKKDTLWHELMARADAAIRDDEKIEPIVAAREVLRPLPDAFLLVDEAPCAIRFTRAMHRSTGGRQYFHNRGGGLGWGMPAAIGVSLARDKAPVLCLVGDGAAMYSPQALWSAVHEEVPVVFVVLNNLEYGILKSFMLNQPQYNARDHGFVAMDICHPKVDFQSLARSMGVASTFVNSHREISEAVQAALSTGKTHLIEIPVKGT